MQLCNIITKVDCRRWPICVRLLTACKSDMGMIRAVFLINALRLQALNQCVLQFMEGVTLLRQSRQHFWATADGKQTYPTKPDAENFESSCNFADNTANIWHFGGRQPVEKC